MHGLADQRCQRHALPPGQCTTTDLLLLPTWSSLCGLGTPCPLCHEPRQPAHAHGGLATLLPWAARFTTQPSGKLRPSAWKRPHRNVLHLQPRWIQRRWRTLTPHTPCAGQASSPTDPSHACTCHTSRRPAPLAHAPCPTVLYTNDAAGAASERAGRPGCNVGCRNACLCTCTCCAGAWSAAAPGPLIPGLFQSSRGYAERAPSGSPSGRPTPTGSAWHVYKLLLIRALLLNTSCCEKRLPLPGLRENIVASWQRRRTFALGLRYSKVGMPLPAVALAAAAAHGRLLGRLFRLGAAPRAINILHTTPQLAVRCRASAAKGLTSVAAAAAPAADSAAAAPEHTDRPYVDGSLAEDDSDVGSSAAALNDLPRRLGAEAAEASRTGAFQRLPMVAPSKELLESALRRAARVPYNKKLKNEAQKAKNRWAQKQWGEIEQSRHVAFCKACMQQRDAKRLAHDGQPAAGSACCLAHAGRPECRGIAEHLHWPNAPAHPSHVIPPQGCTRARHADEGAVCSSRGIHQGLPSPVTPASL